MPVALYHYSIKRITYAGARFNNCIRDTNLKHIICMSKACKDTFIQINGLVNPNLKLSIIYPYVPGNKYTSVEVIENKSKNKVIELLYCAQGIRFVSKGGLEVIESFKRMRGICKNIHLTILMATDMHLKGLRIFCVEGKNIF